MEYFSGGGGGGGDRRPPRKELQMPGSPPYAGRSKKDSYTMRISPPPYHPLPPRPPHYPPPTIYEDEPQNIIQSDPENFKNTVQKLTGRHPQPVVAAVSEPPPPSPDGPRKRRRIETASINTTAGGDFLGHMHTTSFGTPVAPDFSAPARFPIPVMMGQQQQQTMSTPTTSFGAPIPVMTWGHNTFASNPATTSFGAPMPPEFQGFQPTAYPVAMQWNNTLTPFNPPTTSFAAPVVPPPPPPPPSSWDPTNPYWQ